MSLRVDAQFGGLNFVARLISSRSRGDESNKISPKVVLSLSKLLIEFAPSGANQFPSQEWIQMSMHLVNGRFDN